MPCGDGTGPMGTGPAGRGMGPCFRYESSNTNRTRGSFGAKRGEGYRHWCRIAALPGYLRERWSRWFPDPEATTGLYSAEDERKFLLREAENMEQALREIKGRLEEMESDEEKEQ